MKELICIVCPKGCHLKVDEENGWAVSGNSCPKGAEYGRTELQNPTRVLTTTVCVEGGLYPRIPVKTSRAIPKGLLMDAMAEVAKVRLTACPICWAPGPTWWPAETWTRCDAPHRMHTKKGTPGQGVPFFILAFPAEV